MMTTTHAVPAASDLAGRPLATWALGPARAWACLIGVGIAGTLLTAVGSAVGQVRRLGEVESIHLLSGFVAASALVGIGILLATRRPLADYGMRRIQRLRDIGWGAPLLAVAVVVWVTTPPSASAPLVWASLGLTLAVGVNEEVWFRGLSLAAVRRFGHRRSIAYAAVVFGLLHLPNALAGRPAVSVVLQFVLATLVGLVLGEIVAITGSLWVGVLWHILYDFSALIGGDVLTPLGVGGIAVIDAILIGYALVLWRLLPARPRPVVS